jgi:hypothetical protein
MDPLKVLSPSTKTSSTTRVEFTNTLLVVLLVATPSRFSATELRKVLTTGSAPTHGAPAGENKDTSRSSKETAALMIKSTPAHPTLQVKPSSEHEVIS